jgi:hypothetical protein
VLCCGVQVDQLDASARTGGGFNQPQYLHLKESLSSIIQQLNNLQVCCLDVHKHPSPLLALAHT